MPDPRARDPRFPDRPTHPDFARLSEAVQTHDAMAEQLGVNPFAITGVDEDSLMYFMRNRLTVMRGRLSGYASTEAGLMALYLDAFALGKRYAESAQEDRASGPEVSENLVVTVTNPPGEEGAAYRLTLPSGESRIIGDAQDAYGALADIIDNAFDPPAVGPEQVYDLMHRADLSIYDLELWGHLTNREDDLTCTVQEAYDRLKADGFTLGADRHVMQHYYDATSDYVDTALSERHLMKNEEGDTDE